MHLFLNFLLSPAHFTQMISSEIIKLNYLNNYKLNLLVSNLVLSRWSWILSCSIYLGVLVHCHYCSYSLCCYIEKSSITAILDFLDLMQCACFGSYHFSKSLNLRQKTSFIVFCGEKKMCCQNLYFLVPLLFSSCIKTFSGNTLF